MKKNLERTKKIIKEIINPKEKSPYLERIELLENAYMEFVTKEFPATLQEIHNELDSLWKSIKECVGLHQNGLFSEATELFYNNIFSNKSYIDVVNIESGAKFYRMRKYDNGGLFEKNEMFHIPSTKRQLVANERFSLSGMPSLYLADSTYICWEEMGNPLIDNANVSLFVNQTPLSIISLPIFAQEFDKTKILKYPLSYVCSLGTNYPDDSFKEEYTIPQILMQCVLIYNKRNQSNMMHGIKYVSSKVFSGRPLFPLTEKRAYNFVFPAMGPYDENGLSKNLIKSFYWTPPETHGRCRLRTEGLPLPEPAPTSDTYVVSAFHQLEKSCEVLKIREQMLRYDSLEGALTY